MEHFYFRLDGFFNFEELYYQAVQVSPDTATFVEVGSWKGKSAAFLATEIIRSGKNISLFCVDTFEGSIEHENDVDVQHGTLFETFLKNIDPVKSVVFPLQRTSVDAAKSFDDESLDFVFIDASHDYENVLADIKAWYPKVKRGGAFAGHDYNLDNPGVMRAVQETMPLHAIRGGDCWLFIKPTI